MTIATPATATLPPVRSVAAAGKRYRLGRIFGDDGRSVVLPADHGTMLGRVSGLEDPVGLVERFMELDVDGFLLGPGVIARTAELFASRDAPARLLTIDTYWRQGDRAEHVLMTTLARAAVLGVDAVKVLMPWDVPPAERAARSALIGEVIAAADPLGLPVMVEPIVLRSPRGEDAVAIEGDGCRMAAELGADIIKVMYPGDPDLLAAWCHEVEVPIVILGGPAQGTVEELCDMVGASVAAGARGITIGRRVWQRPIEEAAEVLARLSAIVHDGTAA